MDGVGHVGSDARWIRLCCWSGETAKRPCWYVAAIPVVEYCRPEKEASWYAGRDRTGRGRGQW